LNPQGKSGRIPGTLTLEYAILEDSQDKAKELQKKMGVISRSIHEQYKQPEGKGGRVDIKKIDAQELFHEGNENEFLNQLTTLAQSSGSSGSASAFPDILLLDNYLRGSPGSGEETLREISRRRLPVDSILYSEVSNLEDPDQSNPYGRTWSTSYEHIDDIIRQAITKFYLSWTNPEYIRGLMLSRFADLDIALNDLIVELIQVGEEHKKYLTEFSLTRDGLDVARKAKNAASVAKLLVGDGKLAKEEEEKISRFKGDIIRYAGERDDFAHNPILKLYGEGIEITAKSQENKPYSRNTVKKFSANCTSSILEIKAMTDTINKKLSKQG
jgi:hypothetical protein